MEGNAFSVTHNTQRTYVRVGATPVMEITVTYPVLSFAVGEREDRAFSSALDRFNEAYRAMAEAFSAWGGHTPAEEAQAAFTSAGVGAVYTFDRRLLDCRMEVECGEGGILTVRRRICRGSRRGSVPSVCRESIDRWRVLDLSLLRPARPSRHCRGPLLMVENISSIP